MKRNMTPDLKPFLPLVSFLGQALGSNYEVFLYDLCASEHPIVAIENGSLSGRKVGSLMRNVMVKMIDAHLEGASQKEMIVRHDAIGRDGRRYKSSTLLLRSVSGKAVGAICINMNMETLIQTQDFLMSIGADTTALRQLNLSEVIFAGEVLSGTPISHQASVETMIETAILGHSLLSDNEITPSERQIIVDELYANGAFQIKGAVGYLAERLHISETTAYRHIAKAKNMPKAITQ